MITRIRHYLSLPGLGPILVKALTGSAGLRLVGMFFGFLVGVQLARGLGPAGYGTYGTLIAIVSVLMIPTELGVPMLVMREVAASKTPNARATAAAIVNWANRWVILTSTIIVLSAALILYFRLFQISDSMTVTLAFGLLWIPVVAIGNVYAAALRGSHLIIKGQVGDQLIRPALTSVLIYFASLGFLGLLTPALAMLFNVVAAAVALSYSYISFTRSPACSRGAGDTAGLSIRDALPMGMSEGMRILAGQVGILILGFNVPQDQVGVYRVAFGVYVVTTMPSALINSVCSPFLSSLHAQGRHESLTRLNLWIAAFLIVSSLSFLLLGVSFGGSALAFVFGQEYHTAINALLILLVGELAASLFGHSTVVLSMLREQRVVMWWSGIALAVNVLATWWLINAIGYVGAAVGNVLGQLVWRAGCAVYAKRNLNVDTSPLTLLLCPVGKA